MGNYCSRYFDKVRLIEMNLPLKDEYKYLIHRFIALTKLKLLTNNI